MATFIERPEEDENDDYTSLEADTQAETLEQPEETPVPDSQEEVIPEKYQGKDLKDIVRMHQEAEKLLGKQSSEVGELRKIVDDFVKTQLETQKQSPQAQKEEEDIDFFYDPEAAMQKVIDRHPKIKEAEEYTRQAKQASILGQLQEKHPDFKDIVQDEAFAEWVGASKVRTELYLRADQKFDFDSADELLSLWKERKQVKHLVVKSTVVPTLLNSCAQIRSVTSNSLVRLCRHMLRDV